MRNHQLISRLKVDFPAGIVVFLVSIPMSLGIALASGAPLFSGLLTGIIGGLMVAPLSGSQLGISGTAGVYRYWYSPRLPSLVLMAFC